jgi:membrane peptidoglycan carboxypeptidase
MTNIFRNLFKGLLILVIGLVLFLVLAYFLILAWLKPELKKLTQPPQVPLQAILLDRHGSILYEPPESFVYLPVKLNDVPDSLRQATVVIEDRDFYKHYSYNWLTPLRIIYNLHVKKRIIGGSTLNQQLSKNLLQDERSLRRQFKEFILSIYLDQKYSKDEILELYLNRVAYGSSAWGIGTAAKVYFNKPVSELTIAESASRYSPHKEQKDPEGKLLWKVRAQEVLRRLREDSYILETEYDQALRELDSLTFHPPSIKTAPQLVHLALEEFEMLFGSNLKPIDRPATLNTTFDLDLYHQTATQASQILKQHPEIKSLSVTITTLNTNELLATAAQITPSEQKNLSANFDNHYPSSSALLPVVALVNYKQEAKITKEQLLQTIYHPASSEVSDILHKFDLFSQPCFQCQAEPLSAQTVSHRQLQNLYHALASIKPNIPLTTLQFVRNQHKQTLYSLDSREQISAITQDEASAIKNSLQTYSIDQNWRSTLSWTSDQNKDLIIARQNDEHSLWLIGWDDQNLITIQLETKQGLNETELTKLFDSFLSRP